MKNQIDENERFKETFKLLNNDIRKYQYRLDNWHFDIYEKRLLKAFYMFRKNQFEVIAFLRSFEIIDNSFLEGVRLYLLGLSYNHYSKFSFAGERLKQASKIFEDNAEDDFSSYTMIALVMVYANQLNIESLKKISLRLDDYRPSSEYHECLILHAKAVACLEIGEYSRLTTILKRAKKKKSVAIKHLESYFIYIELLLNLRKEDFKKCFNCLEDLKKSKGFCNKILYKLMKTLLFHIAEDQPIYIYENELSNYPEFLSQMELIKALEIGEVERAKSHWKDLSGHNEELYAPNFKYCGSTCLFSIALEKHRGKIEQVSFCEKQLENFDSKVDKLYYVLSSYNGPIDKEKLIELIWSNVEITEKADTRLRVLILKCKKKYGVKIKAKTGTYLLVA